jgi:hypothetical protein
MRSKLFILWVTGLLLLFGLIGSANSQSSELATKVGDDTCDISIEYATAYPGREMWITVWMKNPVPVTGYDLHFLLSSIHATRFFCDTSGFNCFIDTTDCSASAFPNIGCECLGNGMGIRTYALGDTETIPPNPDYRCLFKVRMITCCIPDADTDRSAMISLSPNSYLVNDLGRQLPIHYHPNELVVWWSVPGDASSDSVFNAADVVFLLNYLFVRGPEPCVCEAVDCNNDGIIDIGDLIRMINCLFILRYECCVRGSASCLHEDCWPK